MSFFDEVETTVANTRFLQAIEDTGPIALQYKPIAQLAELEAATRPKVNIDLLLKPNTTAQYLFKQYLCTQKDEDSVQLITAVEQYKKVAGQQRRVLAKKLLSDHPLLAAPPSAAASSSSPPITGSAAAYVVPDGGDAVEPAPSTPQQAPAQQTTPVIHPLAPPQPNTGTPSQPSAQNGHSTSSPPASPAGGGTAPSPPQLPCLTKIVALPPSSHAACQFLCTHASPELQAIQQALQPGSPPPPVNLFDGVLAKLAQKLSANVAGFLSSAFFLRYVQLEDYCQREPKLNEFRIFRVLGRGAFGAVSAVQKVDTRSVYAMKEMGKKQVKADQSEWMVLNERKVLAKMNSPFVLGLKYSFHEDDTLYLIFDMCAGGDLKFHLRAAKDKCFDPARAKFYAAQTLLGLEHIHAQDIVYRDLKPNNILLHQNGNVVISDLGLTIKLRKNKVLKHLAGTAGYWSPEIVMKSGTYKASDYWSFGVMLYEMLTGKRPNCSCDKKTKQWCPFGQKRSMEEHALDPEGILKLDIAYPPDKISPVAKDFLEGLFRTDPAVRLGANDINEIKNHPYFSDIDWEALSCLEVTPPFVPDPRTVNANSIGEVGEFNKTAFKSITITPEDNKMYEGFKYVSPEGVQLELVEALTKIDNPESKNNTTEDKKAENTGGCCVIL